MLSVWFLSSQMYSQEPQTMAITGGTLIDGTGKAPFTNAVVLVEGNRIAKVGTPETVRIPQGARIIDAAGKFILPGLIDTHLHLEMVGLSDVGELSPEWSKPEKLRQLVRTNALLNLASGFTTIRDLGSSDLVLQVRDAINTGRLVGPRIVAAGMQLVKKDSTAQIEPSFLEYDGPDSARAKVRYLAALGVNVIKIRLTHSRPIPVLEEVKAIVEEAHRLGLRATVHTDVPADDLVKLAIDAGADGIEHNAPLRSRDEHILNLIAEKRMSLMAGSGAFWLQRIDTTRLIDAFDPGEIAVFREDVLSALHLGIDSLHKQTQQMKNSGWDSRQRQTSFISDVQRARKAGVLLVFGTDCGAYGMMHGEQYKALYGEGKMGSSAMEVILMATCDAAKALGKGNDLGTIEPGKLADLIILNGNPLIDLRNLRQVFRVIKDGVAYDPAGLVSASGR
jgi:imidazolonepropionase-like amidohydrolase